jgi:penicillin amidase
MGSIPYNAIPQAYDPSSGLVFSANQREVADTYPYYIGTAMDFFSTGYRADVIYRTLRHATHLTAQDMQRLQTDTTDYLAQQMVPELLNAVKGKTLTARQAAVVAMLAHWSGNMRVVSTSATVWWFFINQYLTTTFGPWWKAYHVPVTQDGNLSLAATSEVAVPLVEDLQAWTANDPQNPAFSPPGGPKRSAPQVMRQAFVKTVAELSRMLGPNPETWQWGRVHRRYFASLAQIPALGYGPRASGGDQWTVDAADGGLISQAGPSWRMIVNWSKPGRTPFAEGVYPGGQSENPVSPWYANEVTAWWSGHYYPMGSPSHVPQSVAGWTLSP